MCLLLLLCCFTVCYSLLVLLLLIHHVVLSCMARKSKTRSAATLDASTQSSGNSSNEKHTARTTDVVVPSKPTNTSTIDEYEDLSATAGSQIFTGYRALGHICDQVPVALQFHNTHSYVLTSVGKSYHLYGVCCTGVQPLVW
jgi:membrane protein required for beta-lactamase induction